MAEHHSFDAANLGAQRPVFPTDHGCSKILSSASRLVPCSFLTLLAGGLVSDWRVYRAAKSGASTSVNLRGLQWAWKLEKRHGPFTVVAYLIKDRSFFHHGPDTIIIMMEEVVSSRPSWRRQRRRSRKFGSEPCAKRRWLLFSSLGSTLCGLVLPAHAIRQRRRLLAR